MTTLFCSTQIVLGADVPGGPYTFVIDGNSKVSAGPKGSIGDFDHPIPNAFSLPSVTCCPGSTPTCRAACYVQGLERRERDLAIAYKTNAAELGRVLLTGTRACAIARELGAWIYDHCPHSFRWHVSGDVMHARHAQWISQVCRASRMVRHWIYTRTFDPVCLDWLDVARDNLTVNLSADRDNYQEALATRELFGGRICYMTTDGSVPADLPAGSVIFPDYDLRTDTDRELSGFCGPLRHLQIKQRRMVCPADYFGKSQSLRCGPCTKCIKPNAKIDHTHRTSDR